jgi:glycosyltransferase involved in cell wall biosynthesis
MRAQVAYVLSRDPLVIAGSFASYREVSQIKRPFTFLYHNPGSIRARSLPRYLQLIRHFRSNARLIFITNEPSESFWLRLLGQRAECLGHNLHVREHFFQPDSSVAKVYDAVYCAVMAPYKRIELARQIRRLCLVTYAGSPPPWDLHSYEPRLRHAVFNSYFLSKEDVRHRYCQAYAGLALSSREGAMFSCAEYLLCGLPVVTTKNRGGRNRYLDSNCSTTVPANSASIQSAVERYVQAPPDAEAIRTSVLHKMNSDRERYLTLLRHLATTAFTSTSIEEIWGGENGIEKFAVPLENLVQTCEITRN